MTTLDEFFEKEKIVEKIEVEIPRIGLTFKLHSLKAVTFPVRVFMIIVVPFPSG